MSNYVLDKISFIFFFQNTHLFRRTVGVLFKVCCTNVVRYTYPAFRRVDSTLMCLVPGKLSLSHPRQCLPPRLIEVRAGLLPGARNTRKEECWPYVIFLPRRWSDKCCFIHLLLLPVAGQCSLIFSRLFWSYYSRLYSLRGELLATDKTRALWIKIVPFKSCLGSFWCVGYRIILHQNLTNFKAVRYDWWRTVNMRMAIKLHY